MREIYLFHCGINIRHSTIFMDSRLDGITFFESPKRGVPLYTYLIKHYVLTMVEAGVLVMEDIAQLIGYARRFANDFVHIEM